MSHIPFSSMTMDELLGFVHNTYLDALSREDLIELVKELAERIKYR